MKLLIAVSILVCAVCAVPRVPLFRDQLFEPFNGYLKYLKCVAPTVDQLAMEYDCEPTWDEFREGFLQAVEEFETCSAEFGEYDIEEWVKCLNKYEISN